MKAKTIQGKSTQEIQSALYQLLSDDFKPTLALVFMSVKQDRETVCKSLNKHGIEIFGATTSGEFISSEINEGSIAIMLFDMNRDHFRVMFFDTDEEHSAYDMAKQIGIEGKGVFSNPAFIIASGWLHIDGEQIISGIKNGAESEPPIFGGMAGDNLTSLEPIVFTHNRSSSTGLVAIIIDQEKIDISGIATCGWKPIGITKTVTQSTDNIVFTIDHQPALDIVTKYLGLTIDDEKSDNMIVGLGAYYPLQLQRDNAPPVMRTAMFGNIKDRSLICAGPIPPGSKFRFSLPPDFDVIDTVIDECTSLKTEEQNEAEAVIMFSCVSRYLSFGVMTAEEIERVVTVWDAPFIGFFSWGEFGKSKMGKHEFHNNTCCVVALKEK